MWILLSVQTKRFPYNPLDTISIYSTFYLTMNTYSESIETKIVDTKDYGKALTVQTFPLLIHLFEFSTFTQQASFRQPVFFQQVQADNLFRPFARRAFNIACPARVFIRARKPWVRLRFKLLG